MPFNTLSAYLITAATNNPPAACSATITHAHPVNPCRNGFRICSPLSSVSPVYPLSPYSLYILIKAIQIEKNAICTLRIHMETGARACPPSFVGRLSTFSKYTPANAEHKHATVTAIKPTNKFCALAESSPSLASPLLSRAPKTTTATPIPKIDKQVHCFIVYRRCSIITLTIAVVNNLH